jgi:hypothetical protein
MQDGVREVVRKKRERGSVCVRERERERGGERAREIERERREDECGKGRATVSQLFTLLRFSNVSRIFNLF